MILLFAVLLAVCIGMPLAYAWRIWRLDEASGAAWALMVAEVLAILVLVFIIGRWDVAGHYTRFVLIALTAAAILLSWRRHAGRPWRTDGEAPIWRSHWTRLVSLVAFGAALAYIVTGLMPPAQMRGLAFPLKGGRFMIAHGGGIGLLNHHAGHRQQHYALDIGALNAAGFRASGILPKDLDRYAIFGAAVVSPCEGEVTAARDGLPDLVPPQMDPQNPAGNHVVLSCGGLKVELAHLQQGSVGVEPGQRVAIGDAIGRVGNSGNTSEPHLHIHAVDPQTEAGVAISFRGRFPVRNSVFVR